jgi:hypothetical protein
MGFGCGLPFMCGVSAALDMFRARGKEQERECKRQGKRKKSMLLSCYIRQSIGS